jgi:DNA-binding NarL/FixJ family response regulator
MPVTVLIAEDDPLLRTLLMDILSREQDLEIVGGVPDGNEVLEAVREKEPDLLLLDLHLAGLSGIKVLEALGALAQRPAVLVVSGDEGEHTQLDAARLGARGFLPKSQAVTLLGKAIRTVAGGQLWFSRQITECIFNEYHQLARKVRDEARPLNQLTEREREVLRCVARGLTNNQIARELFMSVHTVKLHIQNILRKLDLPNRTEAAVFAVREGLMEGGTSTVLH